MRCLWILLALAAGCLAQEAPAGIIRGELLTAPGALTSGELVFRNVENRVFQCSYDEHSYFERAKEPVAASAMGRGERVEVVADRKPGTGICYARIVHVLEERPVKHASRRPGPYQPTSDLLAPRGNLTFAGVVVKISPGEMLLRLRNNDRRMILLRSDTCYLGEGQSLEQSNLLVNTRVFVRAGRNWEDQVEAYQVVWGEMLAPDAAPRVVH